MRKRADELVTGDIFAFSGKYYVVDGNYVHPKSCYAKMNLLPPEDSKAIPLYVRMPRGEVVETRTPIQKVMSLHEALGIATIKSSKYVHSMNLQGVVEVGGGLEFEATQLQQLAFDELQKAIGVVVSLSKVLPKPF